MKNPATSLASLIRDCFAGGGATGALIRSVDWSKTPIGDDETWSPALRMMVRLILANRFPLLLWWGPHYCQLYNDAYRPLLGDKHPASMGQPASECFPEIWDVIGPLIDTPFNGGSTSWMDDLQLEYIRYDRLEEAHFTVAYSPVPDESIPGGTGGVLATMYEITEQVVGERRRSALRDLGSRSSEAKTAEEACFIAARTLAQYPEDVPFALLYLHDPHRNQARLAGAAGMEMGKTESPREIDLSEEPSCAAPWPLAEVVRFETLQMANDLQGKLSSVPPGPWSDPPRSAVVLPIRSNIVHQLAGFLVLGLSSRLHFDECYLDFCELVASQLTTAVVTASELVAELTAMNRLHQLSTRLLGEAELHPLLEEVLNATITLQSADFGNVQLYNQRTQTLEIVAQRGRQLRLTDLYALQAAEIIEGKHAEGTLRASEDRFRRYFELGLVMDSTERKRTEEKLAESERRFRQLAESIPHHVWSFRGDDSVGYSNQRLIGYTGLTEEELCSGGWPALHPDDVARVKAAWEKARAHGTAYEMEQRMRGRDGRYRRFMCRAQASRDAQGRPIEWFGTNTDVEERRQAEEALHKARVDLAHLTRVTTMGELAASIAHEMNQPLGAIVNNGNVCLRLLSQSSSRNNEAIEALSDIVNDANRASAIIGRIRGMTQRTLPEEISLQLRDVIADVLALAHRELAEHRIEVRTGLAEDLPRVSGDRVQLQQVLLNLVMNGIEAMTDVEDERRILTIAGQRDQSAGQPSVRITVQDLGSGIEPDTLERLFEAFYSTKTHGMGMGLRISRSIVEAHGGRLWAARNAGPGATFFFALPANKSIEFTSASSAAF